MIRRRDTVFRFFFRSVPVWAVLGLLLSSGCQYHVGSVMHPQVSSIAVGVIANDTGEPSFSSILRGQLSEQFMRDGSLRLTDVGKADAVVEGEIVKYRTRKLARSEVREDRARDEDSDAYQTVIYRAEVFVTYRVRVPGYETPLLKDVRVTGTADFSRFPDMIIPRQAAFRQALNDAALQICSSVTEGW